MRGSLQYPKVATRPSVIVHPSEEEDEEDEDQRPTLPMEVDLDGDDDAAVALSFEDEEEDEEEEEDEDDDDDDDEADPYYAHRHPGPTAPVHSRYSTARKSVGGKAPRKGPVSRKIPRQHQHRGGKGVPPVPKKKKKRPRDTYVVAKETFDKEGGRVEKINSKFRSEIARRSQPQYKEGTIKPAGPKPGKIVSVFRDRPDKESIIGTAEELKCVLRVQQEEMRVFDIVLSRGQRTRVTDTLKTIHFTGYVVGLDPDPYPMGGIQPQEDKRFVANLFASAFESFDRQAATGLKLHELSFRLEVNGHDWDDHGAIEELFYFLINKKSTDPSAKRRRPHAQRRGAAAADPLRRAFDEEIEREKADMSEKATWPATYNYCRDVTIMQLGNYMSFLHTQLDEQMGMRNGEAPIPMDILKAWLATKMWSNLY